MTVAGWIEIALFVAIITALTPVLGAYMARVYRVEPVLLDRVVGPLERGMYRLLRIDPKRGQDWKAYAKSVLVFSVVFWVLLYLILRTQGIHPFNPQDLKSGTYDVSFNTTSSFITNTNWQYYGGETTMSYFSQMAGLAVQNFVSAAVGIAVAVALIRAIASRSGKELGNFYADLTRTLALRAGADLDRGRPRPGLAGRAAEPQRLPGPQHADRRRPDARARAGGLAGGDQGARHQRRRLLQRQLDDAVREPDVDLELRRAALRSSPIPAGADRDLRAHGRQPPPGLGDLRRDARPVHGRASGSPTRRRPGSPAMHAAGDPRLQHGRQGAALRHPVDARSGPP